MQHKNQNTEEYFLTFLLDSYCSQKNDLIFTFKNNLNLRDFQV